MNLHLSFPLGEVVGFGVRGHPVFWIVLLFYTLYRSLQVVSFTTRPVDLSSLLLRHWIHNVEVVQYLDYVAGVRLPIIVNVVPTPKAIRDNLFIPYKASDFCVLIS